MTTPVQQAREALGARLREIRKDADLTARALAATMGSHFTKVSKIENGVRSPTEQDIRSWCTACGAAGQIPDLIATVRHIGAMYHEYRRQMQAGLKHLTESSVPLYEQTSLFRIYDTTVVPGLFTTAEYAAALFRFWTGFMGLADDVDAAVQARLDRQRVLGRGAGRLGCRSRSRWLFAAAGGLAGVPGPRRSAGSASGLLHAASGWVAGSGARVRDRKPSWSASARCCQRPW